MRSVWFILFPLLPIFLLSCQYKLAILSYNVENLFDDVDNGTEYDGFDPERGEWGSREFDEKLKSVAEVLRQAYPGGPDIAALQEVENLNALNKLCDRYLPEYTYRMLAPSPGQAVNCALISRHPIVRTHTLDTGIYDGRKQRYIIEAEIEAFGNRLIVFNNHWKSKIGGVRETEAARLTSAGVLSRRLEMLVRDNPASDIVVIGDLNENLDEYERTGGAYRTALLPLHSGVPCAGCLYLTDDPLHAGMTEDRFILYAPWYEIAGGSYVYQSEWQTPDHFLLSSGLFDSQGFRYEKGNFQVLRATYLTDEQTGFPRTDGPIQGSDHLPLLLVLSFDPMNRLVSEIPSIED